MANAWIWNSEELLPGFNIDDLKKEHSFIGHLEENKARKLILKEKVKQIKELEGK